MNVKQAIVQFIRGKVLITVRPANRLYADALPVHNMH